MAVSNPQNAVKEAEPVAKEMVAKNGMNTPVQETSPTEMKHPTPTPNVKGPQQIQTQRT
jgi:hypothetical protein